MSISGNRKYRTFSGESRGMNLKSINKRDRAQRPFSNSQDAGSVANLPLPCVDIVNIIRIYGNIKVRCSLGETKC